MSTRIDEQFLPWYFGYFTQKGIGFRAIGYWLAEREFVERVIGEQPSINEQIAKDIQNEFQKRVLRPVIAQREIEVITQDTMHVYFTSLQGHLADIQTHYKIPRAEWEEYLAEMASLTTGGKPDTTSLTLKTVYASTSVGGMVATTAMIDSIRNMIQHVGVKHGAKQAAAATTSKAAAKTAAKSGAVIKSKWLGPVFFIVLGWDVADHYRSRKINEPILRENFKDYLAQMHKSLLNDSEAGVMGVIHAVEEQLIKREKGLQPEARAIDDVKADFYTPPFLTEKYTMIHSHGRNAGRILLKTLWWVSRPIQAWGFDRLDCPLIGVGKELYVDGKEKHEV